VKRSILFLLGTALLGAFLSGCAGRDDALAPLVTITEPRSGTVRTGEDLSIIGYALDDEGVVAVRVDGVDLLGDPALEGERGKKLIHFGFRPQRVREGIWRSAIEVEDVGGHKTTLNFPLEIDRTPPIVEITSVEGLGGGRTRVSGVARDNDTVGSIVVNGTPLAFTPAPEAPFSYVAEGEIQITVQDQAGNETLYSP